MAVQEQETRRKRLYALLVGCNYKGSGRPELAVLRSAESDARRMTRFLEDHQPVGGVQGDIVLLVGSHATTDAIFSNLSGLLEKLEQRSIEAEQEGDQPEDTLLFYFSGHGSKSKDGLVIYSWDGSIPASNLLSALRQNPQHSAVVLDCCHAAAITDDSPAE